MAKNVKNFIYMSIGQLIISILFFGCDVPWVMEKTVPKPIFSIESGTYKNAQSVGISSTIAESSIKYTIDGSTPSLENGIMYTNPVLILSSLTLKAIAYKAGWLDSSVVSATYTINGTDDLSIQKPVYYAITIQPPENWQGSIKPIANINATLTAVVSPMPMDTSVNYRWYVDGVEASNLSGNIASKDKYIRARIT